MRSLLAGLISIALVAGCARGRQQPHAHTAGGVHRLAVVGDSVAHGAGDETGRGISGNLAQQLNAQVSNLGIDGARTPDVLRLLGTAAARQAIVSADAIVVSIGGNDLYGDSVARLLAAAWPALHMTPTLDRVAAIVTRLHKINPEARVYLLGLFDPYHLPELDRQVAIWDSSLIARFAEDADVDVVRIADLFIYTSRLSSLDHFHPGAAGYAAIAARIASTW